METKKQKFEEQTREKRVRNHENEVEKSRNLIQTSSQEVPDSERERKSEENVNYHADCNYELYPSSNPSLTSINILPIEMLDSIFKLLEGLDLLRCSQVCSFWKKECEKQSHWMELCKKEGMHIFWQREKLKDNKQDWKYVWKWFCQVRGHIFDPECKDKQGLGTDKTELVGTYMGEWCDNKKEGKGIHIWPDTSRYEGEWKNDKRNGYGIYYWADGRRFEGTHSNDKRSSGTFMWPEGSTYRGEYTDSLRQGWGKFTWPDGDSYEGTWQKGGRHGMGTHTCIQPGGEGTWMQRNWTERTFDFYDKGPKNPEDQVFPNVDSNSSSLTTDPQDTKKRHAEEADAAPNAKRRKEIKKR